MAIALIREDGTHSVLKSGIKAAAGELIDAACLDT